MTADQQKPEASISVILIDDDPLVRKLISKHLTQEGYSIETFENAEDGIAAFQENNSDIVISDIHLPNMSGLELLTEIKKISTATEVIIISGDADKSAAITALHNGAFDMFEKPIDLSLITTTIKRTVRYQDALRKCEALGAQVEMLSTRESERWNINSFIGESKPVKSILDQVSKLAKNDKISVLIRGESGTGKELIAHAIHYGSARSGNPIIPVNCSAIPDDLAESTFFGHTKGSFTGAVSDKKGCFETADGGTLFLDEIGDMPPAIQIKLLRVLEDEVVVPVGANKGKKVNVRIIAATNANLEERVADGTFREDLYFRLARFTLKMPTLNERRKDIPLLADNFAEKICHEMAMTKPKLSEDFMKALMDMDYTGNVRQLRNVIERSLILCSDDELTSEHLLDLSPKDRTFDTDQESGLAIPENLKEAETWLIKRAIKNADGNISEAARRLGVTRAKIYRYK
ncbi:hypothetical protein BVX97_01600 [bacterium E08(2017)]|nr:hypothetical protein BVX97_01600 [bacterium E08(2017)]